MDVELFHDQISTKDSAGSEDQHRDFRSTSRMAPPTDLAGPIKISSNQLYNDLIVMHPENVVAFRL